MDPVQVVVHGLEVSVTYTPFNIPSSLQTISAFTQYPLKLLWKRFIYPHHLTSNIFHCKPPLYTTPAPSPPPKKNGSYTIRGLPNCLFRPLSSSLFEKTSPRTFFENINRCVTYRKNPWILLDSVAPQGATLPTLIALKHLIAVSSRWPRGLLH